MEFNSGEPASALHPPPHCMGKCSHGKVHQEIVRREVAYRHQSVLADFAEPISNSNSEPPGKRHLPKRDSKSKSSPLN